MRLKLQGAVTKTASYSLSPIDLRPSRFRELIITLDVTAADRAEANETYDFYITTNDGTGSWDIAHFPQIATIGAKRYTARLVSDRLAEVTTATPGVAAEPTAIMKVDTAAADEGIKTLGAGKVRHGPWGERLGYELVIAGTTPSITYSITIEGREGRT
jgi:hypothetical protein